MSECASAPSRLYAMALTPPGRGAIATVLIDGNGAAPTLAKCFQAASGTPAIEMLIGRIHFGRWGDSPCEEVIVCRTAEDQFEVHCHGGLAATARILNDLSKRGAKIVEWSNMLRSNFAASIRSQALRALAAAPTLRTAGVLWDQYQGALRRELETVYAKLSAREYTAAREHLASLIARRALGLHLVDPWRVVLAGPPNVGKSSLLNALVGYERAIVFDEPGTTRDLVTARTAIDGWPVELVDMAGLRDSDDALESAGASLAREQLETADLVLWVRDASATSTVGGDSVADGVVIHEPSSTCVPSATESPPTGRCELHVANKCDLLADDRLPRDALPVSALRGDNLQALLDAIARRLVPEPPRPGAAVPFTQGQFLRLDALAKLLELGHTREAQEWLSDWLAVQQHGPLPGEIGVPS